MATTTVTNASTARVGDTIHLMHEERGCRVERIDVLPHATLVQATVIRTGKLLSITFRPTDRISIERP